MKQGVQSYFSIELAKAKSCGTEETFGFYPGKASNAFTKLYTQVRQNESFTLYTVYTANAVSLPKIYKTV
ncbi:MAG: hypothetical protein O3A94_14790 [Proteobacteria bacterium]|nr:hypothetical protein [Pseudomonadota bacterium]